MISCKYINSVSCIRRVGGPYAFCILNFQLWLGFHKVKQADFTNHKKSIISYTRKVHLYSLIWHTYNNSYPNFYAFVGTRLLYKQYRNNCSCSQIYKSNIGIFYIIDVKIIITKCRLFSYKKVVKIIMVIITTLPISNVHVDCLVIKMFIMFM